MKLCDTCIYGSKTEYFKPCIIYRDNCEYYEKKRGDMTDDLIRRQAVFDAIEKLKKIHFDRVVVLNKVRDRVLELSSVNSQEPIAQERYEDLCEYFGDAKDILKNRDDFKAWLGRVKWHIHKAEELYEKYEQEPCGDAISREDLEKCKELMTDVNGDTVYAVKMSDIRQLPSVNPQVPKTGHWIEKDGYDGDTYYDCSECGEPWSTIDGTPWDNGMKYCPNCGARMESEE